jgi:hypothetical protein
MVISFVHAANLRLFDGGGAAGAAAAGDGGAIATTSQDGAPDQAIANQDPSNPGDNNTTPADAGQEATKTPEQIQAEFQKMIRGKYKDAYTKEFQRQFNARFKDAKATQERLDSYQPIIDLLSRRYNISDGDMGKLSSAIRSDRAIWAEAAEAAGLTVEQFQKVQDSELERQRLQAENERLRAAQRQSIQNQMAQRQMEVWNGQVEELKKDYPDFNIEVELANPAFSAMLRAGSSVRNAYEAAHLEEIKQSLTQATKQKTTKEVTDNIRSKGMRPTEVGGSQAGVPLSVDLKNSTKAQRDEWARRAERGETITFQ